MNNIVIFNFVVCLFFLIRFLHRENRIYFHIEKNTHFNKICGIAVMWNRQALRKGVNASSLFYIPIRSIEKLNVQENIERFINRDHQSKLQFLSAKFSWLKTDKEVLEFAKNYASLDASIVASLLKKYNDKKLTQS